MPSQLLALLTMLLTVNGLAADDEVDFVRDVRPIFDKHCVQCHSEKKQESGLRLDVRALALKGGDNQGPDIVPGKAADSPLIQLVKSVDKHERMPPEGDALQPKEIDLLERWITQGAKWPDGIDRVKLNDLRDHWSFKPVKPTQDVHTIDGFIDRKLVELGMERSAPADPVAWLRRVTFDLIGLPPTPEEVDDFQLRLAQVGSDVAQRELVYRAAVDRLLASPRYGERWAQHWLDVVRYADTHGFEVNTERPNAWPYRDYCIAALNADTPYDQFIRQQIAGDAMGQDAATGFLITASVLLPGQIGKDAPSIRLARQDALDEIVNNISQTFLALSVGCARCHDHKFDPITSRDYYAMQACVAGVEYEDRELRTPEAEARKAQAAKLREQVAALDDELLRFVPLARPGSKTRVTSAIENSESFEPRSARFVRFTIHDVNLHPALGLIEPCIDEFEIYSRGEPAKNVALATFGTQVTASGSRTSDRHKLEHIHDGKVGNEHSWMSDTAGRGWVQFELPENIEIDRIVWSRDRTGMLSDRSPIAYRLEIGTDSANLQTVIDIPPLRPAVNRKLTSDRFAPIAARRLRYTILATNSLEPCIDELEVFNAQGVNVALASAGTLVKTSGDSLSPDRHDPKYVNDGLFGNSRSWLGNVAGKGWIELTFDQSQTIDRAVWSRDREGPFEDRLPIDYRIEVSPSTAGDDWQVVADASDRRQWRAGMDLGPTFVLGGLSAKESEQANKLLAQKRTLEARIKSFESGQLAFAGKFRKPDEIHLLSRGDPEQPRGLVQPTTLSAFGPKTIDDQGQEQARRIALANWIASADNPLTSRVMVNRIWQGHFGKGLVETSSDFGHGGSLPTHPELLDWLADQFVQSGWSIKHMHRLVVLSNTYRQSSRTDNARAAQIDADVRYLWRYPSRRLEAEVIRDSMLAISGQLNSTMYDRGFDLFDKRGGLSGFKPVESFKGDGLRRMIYAHKVRREREAVFGAFDCPDAGQSTARRRESTTPIQALNLFNSTFTLEQAAALTTRVQKRAGDKSDQQIQWAYRFTLSRSPTDSEIEAAQSVVEQYGLQPLCRALLNCNEALFLP